MTSSRLDSSIKQIKALGSIFRYLFAFRANLALGECTERISKNLNAELNLRWFPKRYVDFNIENVDDRVCKLTCLMHFGSVLHGGIRAVGFLESENDSKTVVKGEITTSAASKAVFLGIPMPIALLLCCVSQSQLEGLLFGLMFPLPFWVGYMLTVDNFQKALVDSVKDILFSF